jgi:hypothetical protein
MSVFAHDAQRLENSQRQATRESLQALRRARLVPPRDPTGGRLWRLKYELHGHEKLISLGAYPDVTLQRARDRREAARKLICDDIDPSEQRKTERPVLAQTFPAVGICPVLMLDVNNVSH